jgi:hypothetical protein
MKNLMLVCILVLFMFPPLKGFEIESGIALGFRTINNKEVRDIYGNDSIYIPHFELNIYRGFFMGVCYEGDYSASGQLGIYGETSTLEIRGIDVYAGFRLNLEKLYPYIKVGAGFYSYKQTITSEYRDFEISGNKATITLATGLKYFPFEDIFIFSEVKYIPLKVKPLDVQVDFGGIHLQIGIGLRIRIN